MNSSPLLFKTLASCGYGSCLALLPCLMLRQQPSLKMSHCPASQELSSSRSFSTHQIQTVLLAAVTFASFKTTRLWALRTAPCVRCWQRRNLNPAPPVTRGRKIV